MNDRTLLRPLTLSIAAVERDTRISKDTLRVWERRYGFPTPERDGSGDRAYPLDQVEKLRLVRRLLDAGHRPGQIVPLPIDDLRRLSDVASSAGQTASLASVDAPVPTDLRGYLDIVRSHDSRALRRALMQMVMRKGLASFVADVAAPLTALVGDEWVRGQLQVFEEHLYSDALSTVLRASLMTTPEPDANARPRVLLTTFPQEPHGLGILMAEALFALEGCRCLSLGPQTPLWDVVLAAQEHQSHIIALGFTSAVNPNQVIEGLTELRGKLPATVEIWAGGSSAALTRRSVDGVLVMQSLDEIGPQVDRWRAITD
jgi:MerR family transcriptional regulator, light-induced transcriptional regulator